MMRLTIHLKRVKPNREKRYETRDGNRIEVHKNTIKNTITFNVGDKTEAQKIINEITEFGIPPNNVKKWYLSNII